MMNARRPPACSWPRIGFRSTRYISPRLIIGRPHLVDSSHVGFRQFSVELSHSLIPLDHLLALAFPNVGAQRLLENVASPFPVPARQIIGCPEEISWHTDCDFQCTSQSDYLLSVIPLIPIP